MIQEKIIQRSPRSPPRKIRWVTCLGISMLFLGITLLLLRNWLPERIIQSMLVLRPNNKLATTWLKMPMTVPTDVHFFNWTNPEDFDFNNIKPNFEEVGPYRFQQYMEKRNVIWNNNNDTVTFKQMRYWHFDSNFTKGELSDKITSLNAITFGTCHRVRYWHYVVKRVISAILTSTSQKAYITRTVNQLLFDGYDDIVVDIARYLPFIAAEVPRFDRFGWFRLINGSEEFEGVYNMGNGMNGDFEIHRWNYHEYSPFYTGACAKVHGSAGELYSRSIHKDHVGIFLAHLCRNLRFDYEGEVMVNGILGYKYAIGDGVLDNGTRIAGNECFCAGDCMPSGMLNLSSCRYGTPTYVSLPHYYGADPVYVNQVNGIHPEKSKHEAYIILEPKSGLILKAVVRLQLNLLVHPVDDISISQHVRTIFFPLLWIEQNVALPSDAETILKIFLNAPYILIGIATVLICVGLYLLIFITCKPLLVSIYKSVKKRKECRSEHNLEHFSK